MDQLYHQTIRIIYNMLMPNFYFKTLLVRQLFDVLTDTLLLIFIRLSLPIVLSLGSLLHVSLLVQII